MDRNPWSITLPFQSLRSPGVTVFGWEECEVVAVVGPDVTVRQSPASCAVVSPASRLGFGIGAPHGPLGRGVHRCACWSASVLVGSSCAAVGSVCSPAGAQRVWSDSLDPVQQHGHMVCMYVCGILLRTVCSRVDHWTGWGLASVAFAASLELVVS